jgi:hypothetical protein
MEPNIPIVTALVTGAALAAKGVGSQAVRDGYLTLKAMTVNKFGNRGDVRDALVQVEKRPDSEARQAMLKEELQAAGADRDAELVRKAREFLDLLKQQGLSDGVSYSASVTGSGAIAQGPGAVAAGAGGVAIGGKAQDNVIITGSNISGDFVRGDKVMGDKISRQINTGGGAYVGGDVNVTSGSKFVGRDDVSRGDSLQSEDVRSRLTPEGQMIAGLLEDYFDEDELRDISTQIKWDWDHLGGEIRHAKVGALVEYCERRDIVPQLKAVMRLARPQLRRQLK